MIKGHDYYVIIDDRFPYYEDRKKFAYGSCLDSNEIWCQVLEKAYAKLYGSYVNIDAGFVSYALADLTGGIPDMLALEDYKSNNILQLWNMLIDYYKNGFIMGAGSHAHPGGDAFTNEMGIVFSHAYSVLKVGEYDN